MDAGIICCTLHLIMQRPGENRDTTQHSDQSLRTGCGFLPDAAKKLDTMPNCVTLSGHANHRTCISVWLRRQRLAQARARCQMRMPSGHPALAVPLRAASWRPQAPSVYLESALDPVCGLSGAPAVADAPAAWRTESQAGGHACWPACAPDAICLPSPVGATFTKVEANTQNKLVWYTLSCAQLRFMQASKHMLPCKQTFPDVPAYFCSI